MTIDPRMLVALCGTAIPPCDRRVVGAHESVARSNCGRGAMHEVLATDVQMPIAARREQQQWPPRDACGTSLAALDRSITIRYHRRSTRAVRTARAQIVFDIHRDVPEHVRPLRSVSARRSHRAV